jgi:hypothetical protein
MLLPPARAPWVDRRTADKTSGSVACAKSRRLRAKNSEAIFRIDLAAKLVIFRSPVCRQSAGAFIFGHSSASGESKCSSEAKTISRRRPIETVSSFRCLISSQIFVFPNPLSFRAVVTVTVSGF